MIVHPGRLHQLNSLPLSDGPIIYWMSRDQRVNDNWALIHAQQLALELQVPLAVVFILAPAFLGATLRQYGFMLKGLEECAARLAALGIPFYLLQGHPPAEIITFIQQHSVGGVVTDFDPLRIKRGWREEAAAASSVSFIEVDAHNIVPCRVASTKQEFGAYTIRPKIHRLLSDFLEDFPPLQHHPFPWPSSQPHLNKVDYASVLSSLQIDRTVQEVTTVEPGGSAAHRHLRDFILSGLDGYDLLRNDPNLSGQSGLSPYLHFGQISAQRVALEAGRTAGDTPSGDAFLEELVVRRELSDNFCWYNMNYDRTEGFPDWARQTLKAHRHDQREFLYTPEQFEYSRIHDPLWNAAQREMVTTGRMHGYMRMYWAKKILEWSPSPEEAMQIAIYLNDRYELDGRDPNGYTGIAWSIGGVHDRAWGERPVFGKIRYMNDKGCRRKFDVEGYIGRYSE